VIIGEPESNSSLVDLYPSNGQVVVQVAGDVRGAGRWNRACQYYRGLTSRMRTTLRESSYDLLALELCNPHEREIDE